mmetsp:Transcript_91578/g.261746  ORF Transcript_91578/g.261746 Transcript_91578/m.261746 type:complete len:640 (-) Transcript_91578:408-2327(-)
MMMMMMEDRNTSDAARTPHYTTHATHATPQRYAAIELHTVSALSVEPDSNAHLQRSSRVQVWDLYTHQKVVSLPDEHSGDLSCMSFSSDSCMLLAVEKDTDHHRAIIFVSWSGFWVDAESLLILDNTKHKVLFATCVSRGVDASIPFVTGGEEHLSFWVLNGYNSICERSGTFEGDAMNYLKDRFKPSMQTPSLDSFIQQAQRVLCGTSFETHFVAGTAAGVLLIWDEFHCIDSLRAHKSSLSAMSASEHLLLTASVEGEIKLWLPGLVPLRELSIPDIVIQSSLCTAGAGPHKIVHAHIDPTHGTRALIATSLGEVYELSLWSSLATPLISGHTQPGRELWGLATHPLDPDTMVTAGEDGVLRRWSLSSNRALVCVKLGKGKAVHCVKYNFAGTRVALGCLDGTAMVVDALSLETVQDIEVQCESMLLRVTQLAFSKDDNWLVLANLNGTAACFRMQKAGAEGETDKYIQVGDVTLPTPSIRLDLSVDGQVFRSTGMSRKAAYYRTWGGKKDTAEGCSNARWSSMTLLDKADPNMAGLAPALPQGSSPHAMAVSPRGDLVAVGDSEGLVRILPYPCHVSAKDEAQPPPFVAFQAHPAHVTAVAWTADGTKLLTAGSPDLTVKQWAVKQGGAAGPGPAR